MTTEIHGFCDERFRPLQDAFVQNFEDGLEIGASLAVTHKGRFVADLWAGLADADQGKPWQEDTLVQVASTTKIPLIISVLMLVDRGLLALDQTVAHYWPEFAQGGKAHVTVRDVLTHRSGVPGLDPPAPEGMAYDWDAIVARIAAEPHWFGGERKILYHSCTYGYLLGELIRRVDGRRPAQFFREEIAEKCGADFHIGLSNKRDIERIARVPPIVFPAGRVLLPNAARVLNSIPEDNPANWPLPMTWLHLSAEMPAGNGLANGRAIARVCAILANGGELDGKRYLSRAMVEEASREQAVDTCELLGRLRLGLGFGLDSEWFPAPTPTSFHWGGFGGSWGAMDVVARYSAGYAPNHYLLAQRRGESVRQQRVFRALEALYPIMREGAA